MDQILPQLLLMNDHLTVRMGVAGFFGGMKDEKSIASSCKINKWFVS